MATDFSAPDCGGSNGLLTTDTPEGKDLYAASMAAFLAGKKVSFIRIEK